MNGAAQIDTRVAGIAIVASTLLGAFAMAHHPTAAGSADFMAFASRVDRFASINQAVHGVLLALVAVITWGLVVFALRRGVGRSLVTLGLVAWAIGVAAMSAAGIFNGFVVVDVARRALAAPQNSELLSVSLQTIYSAIHVAEILGAVGMSAAMFFWSADLARSSGPVRPVGGLGLAAGAVLVTALLTGVAQLDVSGMMLVGAVWCAWLAGVGTLMILGKV
jgi:hypothetical protein